MSTLATLHDIYAADSNPGACGDVGALHRDEQRDDHAAHAGIDPLHEMRRQQQQQQQQGVDPVIRFIPAATNGLKSGQQSRPLGLPIMRRGEAIAPVVAQNEVSGDSSGAQAVVLAAGLSKPGTQDKPATVAAGFVASADREVPVGLKGLFGELDASKEAPTVLPKQDSPPEPPAESGMSAATASADEGTGTRVSRIHEIQQQIEQQQEQDKHEHSHSTHHRRKDVLSSSTAAVAAAAKATAAVDMAQKQESQRPL